VAERFASVIGGFRTKERRRVLRSLCNAPDIECAAELLKYTGSGRRVILQDLLLVGAEQARLDVLRLALDAGATANRSDAALLRAALLSDSLECLDLVLGAGAVPEPLSLFEVLQRGKPHTAEVVQRLVSAGANPNQLHSVFGSPLMLAARCGDSKATQFLLTGGADASAVALVYVYPESYRTSALSCALTHLDEKDGSGDCLALLMQAIVARQGRDAVGLVDAIVRGDADEAVRLLQAVRAPIRDLAVVEAARVGNARVLSALLRAGCSAKAALPEKECSALSMAVCCGRVECARALLDAGADLTFADMRNSSVLASALLREDEGDSRGGSGPMFRMLLEARRKLPLLYQDSLDGVAMVVALVTHKPTALSALLGGPVPDEGVKVWRQFRSRALLNTLQTLVRDPPKAWGVLSLELVRSFELRFSNALLVQSVQASIHQLKVLDGQLKVDRAATPLAVCIAWIANACAYLGLADLLAAILRSPLLARHFATASDDAVLVALALFSQRNVDDEKCLDEAAKWFVGLPHDRLHPRQLLVVADSAIASKRHSFLRAVLASRLQQTLAPSLSECAMRCAIDRNAIAMDIVLGQNAGATMDQRCFEALSRSCSIGDLATASLLLRRRALPSHVAIETLLISALMRVDLQLDVVELLIAHGADVFATPRGAAASAFGMIRRRQIGHPKCAAFIRRLVLEAQVVPLLVGSTRPERNEPLSLGERAAAYLWRVKRPVDLGANMRSRFYDPAIWRVVARFFCEL
jgi:hypothetical protein